MPCNDRLHWPARLQKPGGHVTTLPWQPTLLLTRPVATSTAGISSSAGKETRQVLYGEDIPLRTLVIGLRPNGIVFTKSKPMCLKEQRVQREERVFVFVFFGKHILHFNTKIMSFKLQGIIVKQ